MNPLITKQLVQKILENPHGYKWSMQGLGMLRLYLSKEVRLHLWDSRFKNPNVSTIHDHPWEFLSVVIAGCLRQVRFTEDANGEVYQFSVLQCGVGGGLKTMGPTAPDRILLRKGPEEVYGEGASYYQTREEIHDSMPEDGTVTIIHRRFTSKDEDHARVFWKEGNWVSAEPRPATEREVQEITLRSLRRWFGSLR